MFDPEAPVNLKSKQKSLIRPERKRRDPNDRLYHYANVAQQAPNIKVYSDDPNVNYIIDDERYEDQIENNNNGSNVGRTYYGLNDEIDKDDPYESKTSFLQRTASRRSSKNLPPAKVVPTPTSELPSLWMIYCTILTFWAPDPILRLFGMPEKQRQSAWREKIGLISLILLIATAVGYITFGFSKTVCKKEETTLRTNKVGSGYIIIHGEAYDLSRSKHPGAAGILPGSNILYDNNLNAGGMDASFLFQNVNGNCKGLILPRENCSIPHEDDEVAWYTPCKLLKQDGTSHPNFTTEYYKGWACHTSTKARNTLYDGLKVSGEVYFNWDDVKNSSRNLVVFNGDVLDLSVINWIQTNDLTVPQLFSDLKDDPLIKGYDISLQMAGANERKVANCLQEIAKVGRVNSKTIGCIASQVVLYVALTFIIAIVLVKFIFAIYFKWFISGKQGAFYMDNKTMNQRDNELEDWSDTKNASTPFKTYTSPGIEERSTFSKGVNYSSFVTMSTQLAFKSSKRKQRSLLNYSDNQSFIFSDINSTNNSQNQNLHGNGIGGDALVSEPIHKGVVPQPPIDYQPFSYPLVHTILFVTAYSESEPELRVTLDSLATSDYPNSHKLIMVVCDGLIKGSGSNSLTPDIAVSLMDNFLVQPEDVEPYSYVAVESGSKRHNMAKVYAGFYKYSDTVSPDKQQRVPMITIVKCGTPAEMGISKPGNRGKRDSQIILMSFLQHLMFDERMTRLEYEMLRSIWGITGLFSNFYEIVLMVDADVKIYPDSITHMVAEMVKDPRIMGLCGETKIANKRSSWVTAIQVFEYYISHHQAKAFESVFGGVTCLPGCFCMYRIKAPKGPDGYWVPILANPDIVEKYADNVTRNLHQKNLLLLGEDRFLSTLMLQTFPKRRQIFVPKAVCKTVVPDKFSVLLSQRRRWINSTVHNLMELVLVKDLCGVFCLSMQFIVFIELIGTLVLPAALSFTIYVIVVAITSKPTPILTLVLLLFILGLPGLLIVITASRWSYILWMLIYLLALPIWNFVLPLYAYWKFDDFSWGNTRVIAGGEEANLHQESRGEFDSSKIVMKRWMEFERDIRRERF